MKKPVVIALIICLSGITWFAIARDFKFRGPESTTTLDEATLSLVEDDPNAPEASDEDKQILTELGNIFATIAGDNPFYMEGTLDVSDPADSLQEVTGKGDFIYYKNGKSVWFKNSDQEMVNTPGYYAVADHQLKKIIVGPSRTIEEVAVVPVPVIGKNLKAEGYTIERTVNNGLAVIRLVNETHVACKEIRVEFDENSRRPTLFYYRLTDLDHPDEKSFDKKMTIAIGKWETGNAKHKLPDLVSIGNNGISASSNYVNFNIIDLINK